MNKHFAETHQVVAGFGPVDMSTGANTGDWFDMKDYGRCAVILFKAAGTAGDDPTLTLQQATDVTGTGAKALDFTRVDVKQGTLASVGTFTTNAQAAANTYTDATSAEVAAIWIVDIKAEDLDIANGFTCIQASIADVGLNAQLGALLYIGHDPHYGGATLPSAIA